LNVLVELWYSNFNIFWQNEYINEGRKPKYEMSQMYNLLSNFLFCQEEMTIFTRDLEPIYRGVKMTL